MPDNIYQKFGELIERNDQYRWLGSGSLLGDRNSGFSGVRIFAKYVFDKKQRDINALNSPHSDNKLCLEFIEYLGEKAKESTDDGIKKQYEEMASRSVNMLHPGGNGQMNDKIFVEYANSFYQLGIGSDKETIVAKFMEALEMVKREKPALSKQVEGITSPIPQKMEPKKGQAEPGKSAESKPLGTEGSLDFSEEGEQDSSLDISSKEKTEAEAKIVNPKETQIQEPLTKRPEEETENPSNEKTEEQQEEPLEKKAKENPEEEAEENPEEGSIENSEQEELLPADETQSGEMPEEGQIGDLSIKPSEIKPQKGKFEQKEARKGQRRKEMRESHVETPAQDLSGTRLPGHHLQEPVYSTGKGERKRGKGRKGKGIQRGNTNERMRGNQKQMASVPSAETKQAQRASPKSGGAKIARRIFGPIGAGAGIWALLSGGSGKGAAAMTFALIKIFF